MSWAETEVTPSKFVSNSYYTVGTKKIDSLLHYHFVINTNLLDNFNTSLVFLIQALVLKCLVSLQRIYLLVFVATLHPLSSCLCE